MSTFPKNKKKLRESKKEQEEKRLFDFWTPWEVNSFRWHCTCQAQRLRGPGIESGSGRKIGNLAWYQYHYTSGASRSRKLSTLVYKIPAESIAASHHLIWLRLGVDIFHDTKGT